jgi:hypothetical protein
MKLTCATLLGALGAIAISAPARADEVLNNLSLLEQLSRSAAEEIAASLEVDPSTPITVIATTPHEGNAFVKRILAESLAARGYQVTVARSQAEVDTASAPDAPAARPGNRPPGAAAGGPASADPVDAPAADTTRALVDGGPPPDGRAAEMAMAAATPVSSKPFQVTAECTVPLGTYPDGVTLDLHLLEFGVQYKEVGRRYLVGPVSFTRVAGVYAQVSALNGPRGQLADVYTAQKHHWDRVVGRERALAESAEYPYRRPELNAPGLGNYVEPAVVVGIVGSLIYLFYANQN